MSSLDAAFDGNDKCDGAEAAGMEEGLVEQGSPENLPLLATGVVNACVAEYEIIRAAIKEYIIVGIILFPSSEIDQELEAGMLSSTMI